MIVTSLLACSILSFFKSSAEEPKAGQVIRESRKDLDIVCNVTIPADLKEEMTFIHKDGSTEKGNAREMYKQAYEEGWQEYLEYFQKGEMDLDETHVMPIIMAEWGLTMNARQEGFDQCRKDLLDYEKKHNITFKPLKNPHIKALLNAGIDLEFKNDPPAYDEGPTRISLHGKEFSDTHLKPLQNYNSIIEVDASGTSITDLGLEYLQKSSDISRLDLGGTAITDKGIDSLLSLKKLEILSLSNTAVTDVGVSKLAALSSLDVLELEGCAITDQALIALANAPKLRCLYLGKEADESFALSFKPNPQSRSLDVKKAPNHPQVIKKSPKITDVGLAAIAKMKGLESLGLEGSNISDKGLAELRTLKRLEMLRLDDTPITDAGLQSLASLPELDYLSLVALNISNDGIKALGGLEKLEILNLTDCKLTDACLVHLEGCSALTYLWRTGTQITDQGIKELQKNLPKLRKN